MNRKLKVANNLNSGNSPLQFTSSLVITSSVDVKETGQKIDTINKIKVMMRPKDDWNEFLNYA